MVTTSELLLMLPLKTSSVAKIPLSTALNEKLSITVPLALTSRVVLDSATAAAKTFNFKGFCVTRFGKLKVNVLAFSK